MVDTVIWCILSFLFGLLVGMGLCAWWLIKPLLKNGIFFDSYKPTLKNEMEAKEE